jgi:hypothetical protein
MLGTLAPDRTIEKTCEASLQGLFFTISARVLFPKTGN